MRSAGVIQGAGVGMGKEETRAHYAEKNDGLGWRMGIPVGMQIGYREINPSGNCQFIHCPSPRKGSSPSIVYPETKQT